MTDPIEAVLQQAQATAERGDPSAVQAAFARLEPLLTPAAGRKDPEATYVAATERAGGLL